MIVCPICLTSPGTANASECECRRLGFYHGPPFRAYFRVNPEGMGYAAISAGIDGSPPTVISRESPRPLDGEFPGEFRDIILHLHKEWLTSKVMGC